MASRDRFKPASASLKSSMQAAVFAYSRQGSADLRNSLRRLAGLGPILRPLHCRFGGFRQIIPAVTGRQFVIAASKLGGGREVVLKKIQARQSHPRVERIAVGGDGLAKQRFRLIKASLLQP